MRQYQEANMAMTRRAFFGALTAVLGVLGLSRTGQAHERLWVWLYPDAQHTRYHLTVAWLSHLKEGRQFSGIINCTPDEAPESLRLKFRNLELNMLKHVEGEGRPTHALRPILADKISQTLREHSQLLTR